MPSGLALANGVLYVAEYSFGSIAVFDTATGFRIRHYSSVAGTGLMGLAFAPGTGDRLFGVNAITSELVEFQPAQACGQSSLAPYATPGYNPPSQSTNTSSASCIPNSTLPNASLFDQVHTDSGYASSNQAVQDDSMVDNSSYYLRFRTDCANASLNFDAFLLGGYLCHPCLPDNCAVRDGGMCTNVWWEGYTCDNEVRINFTYGIITADRAALILDPNRTYRFIVNTPGTPMFAASNGQKVSDIVDVGTMKVTMTDPMPTAILGMDGQEIFTIQTLTTTTTTTTTGGVAAGTCVLISSAVYSNLVASGRIPVRCGS